MTRRAGLPDVSCSSRRMPRVSSRDRRVHRRSDRCRRATARGRRGPAHALIDGIDGIASAASASALVWTPACTRPPGGRPLRTSAPPWNASSPSCPPITPACPSGRSPARSASPSSSRARTRSPAQLGGQHDRALFAATERRWTRRTCCISTGADHRRYWPTTADVRTHPHRLGAVRYERVLSGLTLRSRRSIPLLAADLVARCAKRWGLPAAVGFAVRPRIDFTCRNHPRYTRRIRPCSGRASRSVSNRPSATTRSTTCRETYVVTGDALECISPPHPADRRAVSLDNVSRLWCLRCLPCRELHRQPELAFAEHRTAAWWSANSPASAYLTGPRRRYRRGGPAVQARLSARSCCAPHGRPAGRSGRRAPLQLHVPGVTHTCGHYGHVAILLAVLEVLAAVPAWPSRIIACFNRRRNHQQVSRVVEAQPTTGCDDFARYLATAPGCYFRVGCAPVGGAGQPHHHPAFDLDETSLAVGVEVLARSALLALAAFSPRSVAGDRARGPRRDVVP